MLRFLPKKDANVLKREYRFRFLIILSIIVSSALLVWMILLIPAYISLHSEENIIIEEINSRENFSYTENSDEIIDRFDLVRQVIIILKEEPAYLTEKIREIIEVQKDDVSINTISFSKENNKIILSGLASSRESLKTFGDSLKKLSFENVDVPFSNFAGSINIPYTITITLKP